MRDRSTPAAALDTDVVGAYVADRTLPLDDGLPADRLTHVFYAFADVVDGVIDDDAPHLDDLTALKREHPHLRVSASVGGWNRCEGFHGMAATAERRERFAESAVRFVREHGLDGLDFDWEFPAAEARDDHTAMLRTLRDHLDAAGDEDGTDYLLTAATSTFPTHLAGVDLPAVAEQLDFLNAMTYDMLVDDASHHTNLYTSEHNPRYSLHRTVQRYLDAGVPKSKLVVGSGFYSRGGVRVGYDRLVPEYVESDAYERRWDEAAEAPYLVGPEGFVSYDDPRSVRRKVDYVRDRGLRGLMFWEYGHDREDELTDAVCERMIETAGGDRR